MSSRTRVLVVDDEDDMCWALQQIVELDGHECVAARSATEALRAVGKTAFDLAFVDVKLQDMEGLELVERIRQMSPSLPCVLVSGFFYGDDGPVQERIARGLVVGFISKPFLVEDVLEAIERFVGKDE